VELRHLRYFVGVARHLSYSEASRRLHVAQPAISQTILDLEDEVDARLLHRTKRSVELTAAGAVFLHEAEQILAHANSFVCCLAQIFRQSRIDGIPGNFESVASKDQKADGKIDPPIERSCLTNSFMRSF
jgi:DNA-binding transcriptional LysR family regulator